MSRRRMATAAEPGPVGVRIELSRRGRNRRQARGDLEFSTTRGTTAGAKPSSR